MQLSARELAAFLGGVVEGDPEVKVSRPSKIEEGGVGTISFLGNLKYEPYAYTTSASILLVSKDFKPSAPVKATLIRVDDVYASVASLLEQFGQQATAQEAVISDKACIDPGAKIGMQLVLLHSQ
jgi:UDP-3-O-[3-hydroxymyristoyl] glucosamine N-acyltransferase